MPRRRSRHSWESRYERLCNSKKPMQCGVKRHSKTHAVQGEARSVFTPVALNHQLTLQRFLAHGLNGSSIASDPSSLPSTHVSRCLVAHVLHLFSYKKNNTVGSQQHHNPSQGIHPVLIEVCVSVMLLDASCHLMSCHLFCVHQTCIGKPKEGGPD